MRSPDDLLPGPAYFQRQIALTSKHVGYVGSYSREMLSVEQERDHAFGQMLARFTTCILSGRTVTAKQRATVKVRAGEHGWRYLCGPCLRVERPILFVSLPLPPPEGDAPQPKMANAHRPATTHSKKGTK